MSFTESVDEIVADDESGLLSVHPTWVRVRLADVCSILNGFPFASKQFKPTGGTPLIRIRDVVRGRTETHFVGEFDATFIVRHGELVVGMDGDFNCALWSGGDALLNQRVCKLTPDERHYDLRLLAHALPGYLGAINSKTSAITVKHLSSKTVAEIPLPLPPRQEQARLAEALESYFTRLDDAVATLERVQRNLKRYRASVLKAAVEGRLVPTEAALARAEGRNYEPASTLLTRILAERRRRWEEAELARMTAKGKTPKDDKWKAKYVEPVAPDTSELPELAEGWCWASIDQLAPLVRNGYSKKPVRDGAVRILRISAVRSMNVDFADVRWLPGSPEDYSEDLVAPGDLLFTRYNGSPALVGVAGLVRSLDLPTVHPDKLIKVRLLASDLDLPYLELASNTGASRLFLEGRTRTTAGQAGISGGDIKQMPIPLPPRAEQSRISGETDRSITLANAARETLVASAFRATRLRQSILKWAFEGRLVDQDPADEPASVLLERIRAERASADGAPPMTRGRRPAHAPARRAAARGDPR